MSTLEITSAKGEAIAKLARLVASSAAFQDEAGVDEAEDLLHETSGRKRVHYPCLRADKFDEIPLPFAVLEPGEMFVLNQMPGTAVNYFLPSGSISMMLARAIGEDNSDEGAFHEFLNWEEKVIEQIIEHAGESDELNIVGVSMFMPPSYTDKRHESGQHAQVPRYQVGYTFEWEACQPP